MSRPGKYLILALLTATRVASGESKDAVAVESTGFEITSPRGVLTNASQFRTLSERDYLNGCRFQLRGVITLIDSNRNLCVLQDGTGAIALNCDLGRSSLEAGQLTLLEGSNCYPYIASFPDFPFRPSGREVRASFEAPRDWGEYHLTRMRAWLRPAVTGEYAFWTASDNSSELWLSPSEDPSKARRIASIPRYGWALPREWSKYPSQRSETIWLNAGKSYYIEALQEQTTIGDNLAVAWQGPNFNQRVIDSNYLTPWVQKGLEGNADTTTNGVLYEYWTNFSAGDLEVLRGPKPFESAVSADSVRVNILGQGKFPSATECALNRPLPPENNFCWVHVEGMVAFAAIRGETGCLELSGAGTQIQVQVQHLTPEMLKRLRHSTVRIEGVCEGGRDKAGNLMPGLIWAPWEKCISFLESADSNLNASSDTPSTNSIPASNNVAMEGFYGTRAVVTFSDRVFDKDYIFVQTDATAIFVSLAELRNHHFENRPEVGRWVDLGGALRPGRYVPVMDPLVITEGGPASMPAPLVQSLELSIPGSIDGRWTEIEGVVHSVSTNGLLVFNGKDGPVYLWLGQMPPSDLTRYVDAKLRVRGVISLTVMDAPLLLCPSPGFVDVEDAAPEDPFELSVSLMAHLLDGRSDNATVHRARVRGEVIYYDDQNIIIQDASSGVLVQAATRPRLALGKIVDVVGFPTVNGSTKVLMDSVLRVSDSANQNPPGALDFNDALSKDQNCTLVEATATLLAQKKTAACRILQLQEQQRIFTATLASNVGDLPPIASGSRVRVLGVCDDGLSVGTFGKAAAATGPAGALNLLLRTPADVVVLRGPPWWTLQRTIGLVVALLTIMTITLSWVYFLRRRLERQQALQLAISRQILRSQESERQRIAINLHDSLGQNLSVIKNQARLAMQPTDDEATRQERLNKISEITSHAIEEVRQITHDLRPYQLDRLGLTQAVRAIIDQVAENSTVVIASHLDDIDGIFGKESEIHVYRIVQESLNNVLKHSAATEAAVVVKNLSGAVSLSIRDNGCGFDAKNTNAFVPQESGHGLSGITERVSILGGTCSIDSSSSSGTSITVEIPKSVSKK